MEQKDEGDNGGTREEGGRGQREGMRSTRLTLHQAWEDRHGRAGERKKWKANGAQRSG